MEKQLSIALILKPQGIRGEVKVKIYTDTVSDLASFKTVYIGGNCHKLLNVRGVGECAILALSGVADRNQAELLRGKEITVLREDTPELPEGRYYIVDLIGCSVLTETGKKLGVLCDAIPAKTDIYTVDTGAKKIMFAGVEGVILSVDIENKVICVCEKRYNEVAVLD
ncbi:MAG: 16S rRNA processing protein RimM [Clostridia bacterium]|nr:16S rRNA processing protein RimM [Clostridia bacterium]